MAGAQLSSAVEDDEQPPASAQPSGAGQFRFVTGTYRPEDRSHVMRESWRQRKGQTGSKPYPDGRKHKLAKKPPVRGPANAASCDADGSSTTTRTHGGDARSIGAECRPTPTTSNEDGLAIQQATRSDSHVCGKDDAFSSHGQLVHGIPFQAAATAMGYSLAASKTDPFDTCPVPMVGDDQRLLHHWLSIYATMMITHPTEPIFNPMRDVWIPMDFSNPASFHGMLAHSASHLAYLRGEKSSIQAMVHKLEATRLINQWLCDPAKETSDDVMSATLRLLTFERYWGTEDVWRIHRNGLDQMLKARGGFESFGNNWRLELVIKLVSLMSKPSWFYAANEVSAISHEPSFTSPSLNATGTFSHRRLQGLWFLSFVEDIRTLTIALATSKMDNAPAYPGIAQATLLLYLLWSSKTSSARPSSPDLGEKSRLTCLLYLLNILRESKNSSSDEINFGVAQLDLTLQQTESFWSTSAENLQFTLVQGTSPGLVSSEKLRYITSLIEAIRLLNPVTRRRVEQCLLQVLGSDMIPQDDGESKWTVDTLLTEIRGQIWGT
ncbi:MAG: hypothetical protein M1818_001512 [Claussenomyces sp. TS43310]|nr:MAG: hypothetical protein M1818_001512 [Claussenomyces sp. TS43310]